MKKENCPECKNLPEGEVVKGHDHRTMNNEKKLIKLACEVFGISEKEALQMNPDFIRIADIMVSILDFDVQKVQEFIRRLAKLDVKLEIKRELPEDCKETVEAINRILDWHKSEKFLTCGPDDLVKEYNTLAAHKATLSERTAWYGAQATLATMNRRNWRAGIFTSLRTFGKDLETNIRKKTTVSDTENQSEMLAFAHIKTQVYLGYVAENLEGLTRTTKDVLRGIEQRLIELRYQRKQSEQSQDR